MEDKIVRKEIMKGKKGLIAGVMNDRSIAWGIAKALYDNGAEIALAGMNKDRLVRVCGQPNGFKPEMIMECDVKNSNDIDTMIDSINEKWGKIDFFVHAIAFSSKDELQGRYVDTSLDNFLNTMHVSCYSFVEMTRKLEPLMEAAGGGTVLTLSYYGAEKVIPNYNVMGIAKSALEASIRYMAVDLGDKNIRINGISSGPIRTISAQGIGNFRLIGQWTEENSALGCNASIYDNGNTALYLLSDLSSSVTGEIIHVDAGYNLMGLKSKRSFYKDYPKLLQKDQPIQ